MENPDLLWKDICYRFRKQSKCKSRQVACLIVRDGHVIMQGWNGAPSGSRCDDCKRKRCMGEDVASGLDLDKAICSHAESNAIGFCARMGASTAGATMYCANFPCSECAKLIISSGISKVVYYEGYAEDEFSKRLFKNADVLFEKYVE